jgi:hypothetical protein
MGTFVAAFGNITHYEINWSGGLTIVILTCAMVMPVYMPEHGGMSQRAQQSILLRVVASGSTRVGREEVSLRRIFIPYSWFECECSTFFW